MRQARKCIIPYCSEGIGVQQAVEFTATIIPNNHGYCDYYKSGCVLHCSAIHIDEKCPVTVDECQDRHIFLYISTSVYQIADILQYTNDSMEKSSESLCSQCQNGNGRKTVTIWKQMCPDLLNS